MGRSLPHGLYSLLLVLFAVIGWSASLWQGDGCNYAIVSGPIVDQLDPYPSSSSSQNPIKTLELGFDSYRELPDVVSIDLQQGPTENNGTFSLDGSSNSSLSMTLISKSVSNATDNLLVPWSERNKHKPACIDYPEEVTLGIIDSKWTTSRSFAFLGLVTGGAGTTFLCCSLCFVFSRVTWRWTGYGLLLAAFCQLLSLVAWFSTQMCSWNNCGWSLGSVSDVCAVGVWTITGLMILCHYPKKEPPKHSTTTIDQKVQRSDPSSPGTLPNSGSSYDESELKDPEIAIQNSYDDDEYDEQRYPRAQIT